MHGWHIYIYTCMFSKMSLYIYSSMSGHAMLMSVQQRDACAKFIKDAEGGRLVSSMAECVNYLLEESLAYRQVIRCGFIGCHEENRDRSMIDCAHVSELLESFACMGWLAEEAKGIAVELNDDSASQKTRDANEHMCEESCGKLAPASAFGKLRFASLQGSHANQAFRAILFGCEHDDPSITEKGRLTIQKVPEALKKAIETGIEWTIITRPVLHEFPSMLGLIQASGNATQQQTKCEDELQMGAKIFHLVQQKGFQGVSWKDVQGPVLRSRPPCRDACPWIFGFVLKYSGATSAGQSLMHDTERFVRVHGKPSRQLGVDIWQNLSVEVKGNQLLLWRHMVLKLAFCSPDRCFGLTDVPWMDIYS